MRGKEWWRGGGRTTSENFSEAVSDPLPTSAQSLTAHYLEHHVIRRVPCIAQCAMPRAVFFEFRCTDGPTRSGQSSEEHRHCQCPGSPLIYPEYSQPKGYPLTSAVTAEQPLQILGYTALSGADRRQDSRLSPSPLLLVSQINEYSSSSRSQE